MMSKPTTYNLQQITIITFDFLWIVGCRWARFLHFLKNRARVLAMPITTSAKKSLRNSRRKKVFNLARKKTLAIAVKNLKKLIDQKKVKEARAMFPTVQKAFDKAVKTNLIKANTASRKKTRLIAAIKKVS